MTPALASTVFLGACLTWIVMVAFLMFVAKGVLFSAQLFTDALTNQNLWIGSGLLDIGILGTIFAAMLKR